ncbi:LacI family DNA-binding transcriptional regulator [Herbiconiux sp. A18JL235]|uniref:LacI family DNA-binding transcriptional regulator n=1 Tax=Herbiconiux sp. A18JL235 TaxID=3152363 RepID=A0AB39BHY9_9MICO
MATKRPTIVDVAKKAGVSKSLVSLVMREAPGVSDERRAMVLRAADELGYRVNFAARSLTANPRSGKLVGFVIRDLEQPWASDVVDIIKPIIEDAGYTVLLTLFSPTNGSRRLDFSALDVLRDLRVTGLVFIGSMHDHPALNRVDFARAVVYSGWGPDGPTADAVRGNDQLGLQLVVDHLVGLGHRRIVHVSGIPGAVATDRADGYRKAMQRHGLREHLSVIQADYTISAGHAAAMHLLRDNPEPPTAITCADDMSAMGVMSAVAHLGLDVAVTGYDNIAMSALSQIDLTTVDQNNAEMAERSARALLARLEQPGAPFMTDVVRPRLVVRGSSFRGVSASGTSSA